MRRRSRLKQREADDRGVARAPSPARHVQEAGLTAGPGHTARPQDAALRRRAVRRRAGQAARRAVRRHRAQPRVPEEPAPRRGRRRHDRRRLVLPLSHHDRGPRGGGRLSQREPVRRCRAGSAGPVPRVHGPRVAAPDHRTCHARRGSRGVLAPRAERHRARRDRAGHQRRPLDLHLRSSRQRQDDHRPGRFASCSAATSRFRTRSRWKAASFASSIPSTTKIGLQPTTTTTLRPSTCRPIGGGRSAAGRSSLPAAS